MKHIGYSIAIATCLAAPAAYAHHSDAGYDRSTIVAFDGTIDQYLWRNPHVFIRVGTINEAGEPVLWEIETGSTPIMMRSGWGPDTFAPGDAVAVRLHPERNSGRTHGILSTIERADGEVYLQVEGDEPEAPASASSITGVWRGSPRVNSAYRRAFGNHPVTDKAVVSRVQYDPLTDSPAFQCVPAPAPGSLGSSNYLTEIQIQEETVTIRNELLDAARTVFLDGREHPDAGPRANQGHSIGHWEDDTLVVDTTLFSDHPSSNGNGIPGGARRHLVERYSLNEDGTRLVIDVRLEDQEYLVGTFGGRLELVYSPQLEFFRYNCQPDG